MRNRWIRTTTVPLLLILATACDRVAVPGAAQPSFRLQFQFLEANGPAEADPAVAEVVRELHRTLGFEGYTLTGETRVDLAPEAEFTREIATDDRRYSITGSLRVAGEGQTLTVGLRRLRPGGSSAAAADEEVLATTVRIRSGETLVLGTVPGEGSAPLLVVARVTEV